MLSLNHLPICPKLYLFRETPHFINSICKELEPNEYYLLDIPELSNIIELNMNMDKINKKCIYDYIFLCFFLGNDFMPHFPSINIRTGGIEKMLNAYSATIGSTKEILTDGKIIYWKNVRKIVLFLAEQEENMLKQEYILRNKREKYILPMDTKENIFKKFDLLPSYERNLEKYINPFSNGWEERYYKILFNIEYCEKRINTIANNYIEGLEWTMKYYTSGCPNWRWSYNYSYPPLLKDLLKVIPYFETEMIMNKVKNPVHPLVQLSYVLPKRSLNILPNEYFTILNSKDWYQNNCEFKWAFCKYFWESHVQLPEINIQELETLIENIEKENINHTLEN
jgi:5'-3' exonuclease